jgi:hypothetical protein
MKTVRYTNMITVGVLLSAFSSKIADWLKWPKEGEHVLHAMGWALMLSGVAVTMAERWVRPAATDAPPPQRGWDDIKFTLYAVFGGIFALAVALGFAMGGPMGWSEKARFEFVISAAVLCLCFLAATRMAYQLAEPPPEPLRNIHAQLKWAYPKWMGAMAVFCLFSFVSFYFGGSSKDLWQSAMPGVLQFLVFAVVLRLVIVSTRKTAS